MGVSTGDGHVGQILVDGQQLLPFPGQEAAEAHPGVDEDVGLSLDPQGLGHSVEGGARLVGADGADGTLAQQGLQLAPVGGGAEHQDGLVLEPGVPEAADVLGLVHGEAVDPLGPEEPGQLDEAGAVAVSGQNREDGRLSGPLPDGRNIVFQRCFLKNQLFHVKTTTFCTEINQHHYSLFWHF